MRERRRAHRGSRGSTDSRQWTRERDNGIHCFVIDTSYAHVQSFPGSARFAHRVGSARRLLAAACETEGVSGGKANSLGQTVPSNGTDTTFQVRRDAPTALERAARPTDLLLIAHDHLDPRGEKIRALRTELMLRRGPTVRADLLALMSPCHGEGRSLLAAELAIAFAQTGRPTLLVDADLRHPRQHALFGADNAIGLAQAIESGDTPHLLRVQGLPRMSLLTAGPIPSNPLEMLLSDTFASLVEEWRRNFDYVVFDTAPMKNYADALAVASLVARVLTLSRAQHTPAKEMRDMLRRLSFTRSQILGTVISHF